MSYDLTLYHLRAGATIDRVLESIEESGEDEPDASLVEPIDPRTRKSLVAALMAIEPGLTGSESEDSIELDCEDESFPCQIGLYPHEAGIGLAYWGDQPGGSRMIDRWSAVVRVFLDHGFTAFDPQLGRALDLDEDIEKIRGEFDRTSGQIRSKPWWKFW